MTTEQAAKLGKLVASQSQLENDLAFLMERVDHLIRKLRFIDLDNVAVMRATVEELRFDAESLAQGLGDIRYHLRPDFFER